ncbi:MAG TPA: caspase family protein, partial [Myxococcaceae bacterium]|nr:caspase family protein [Myxococcaceae bacterium]
MAIGRSQPASALRGGAIAALICCVSATPARADDTRALRRLALVIGNNDGGEGTRPLLYAGDDARKFHDILLRLGGVRREDATLLLGGTAEEALRAMTALERKAQEASRRGERTALFLYYSGHAQDGALRLGQTRLPFAALKNRLAQAPADVRVGIFDACQSGEMTRRKGARR